MKRTVRDWYFRKVVTALRKSEIRYELHPRANKRPTQQKADVCQGYSQRFEDRKWLIVIRYRPSSVNEMYVLIHEALHLAFPEWPERYCWGEPIDLMARQLLHEFSTNQLKELETYLPKR